MSVCRVAVFFLKSVARKDFLYTALSSSWFANDLSLVII